MRYHDHFEEAPADTLADDLAAYARLIELCQEWNDVDEIEMAVLQRRLGKSDETVKQDVAQYLASLSGNAPTVAVTDSVAEDSWAAALNV